MSSNTFSYNHSRNALPYQPVTSHSNAGVARARFTDTVNEIEGIHLQNQPGKDPFQKSSGVWYKDLNSDESKFWSRRLVCCIEPDVRGTFPFCDVNGNAIKGLSSTAGLVSFEPVFRSRADFSGLFLVTPKPNKYQDTPEKNVSWSVIGFSRLPLRRFPGKGSYIFDTDKVTVLEAIGESSYTADNMKRGSDQVSPSPFQITSIDLPPPEVNVEEQVPTPVVHEKGQDDPSDTYEQEGYVAPFVIGGPFSSLYVGVVPLYSNEYFGPVQAFCSSSDMDDDVDEMPDPNQPILYETEEERINRLFSIPH